MAKGAKTGGKNFAKGKSGNPSGRPPLPAELKALRSVTNESIKDIMDLVLDRNIEEVKKIAESKKEPTLKVWLAKGVVVAAATGNMGALDPILNRILGKVPDAIKTTGEIRVIIEDYAKGKK